MIGLYFGVFLHAICSTLRAAHLLLPEMGPQSWAVSCAPTHTAECKKKKKKRKMAGGGGGGGVTSSPPNAAAHFSPRAMFTSRHLPPSLPPALALLVFFPHARRLQRRKSRERGGRGSGTNLSATRGASVTSSTFRVRFP